MPASEENLTEPLDILKKYGYAKGVLHKLATDSDVSSIQLKLKKFITKSFVRRFITNTPCVSFC